MKNQNNKLLQSKIAAYGCVAVFLILVSCGVLAYYSDWKYLIIAVLVLVAWTFIGSSKHKNLIKCEEAIFEAVFGNMEEGKPHYYRSDSFGYPSYEVTFVSAQQMSYAERDGLIEHYKNDIQNLHSNTGFDSSRGIFIKFIGQVIESQITLGNGEPFISRMLVEGVQLNGSPNYRILDGTLEDPPPDSQ